MNKLFKRIVTLNLIFVFIFAIATGAFAASFSLTLGEEQGFNSSEYNSFTFTPDVGGWYDVEFTQIAGVTPANLSLYDTVTEERLQAFLPESHNNYYTGKKRNFTAYLYEEIEYLISPEYGSSWGSGEYSIVVNNTDPSTGISGQNNVYSGGVTYYSDYELDPVSKTLDVTAPGMIRGYGNGWHSYYINTINIGSGVTGIGDYAFYYQNNVETISIPDTVTSLEYKAFANCSSLASVTIPASVISIGGSAFECRNLESIYFEGDAPEVKDADAIASLEDPSLYYNSPSFVKDKVTLYYWEGTEGWETPEWNGYKTEAMQPTLPTPDAPPAPELADKTAVSVILNAIVGAGYEYAVNTTDDPTDLDWQNTPEFTGLSPNTDYYFFARIMAILDTSNASPASEPLQVTTDKAELGGTVEIYGTAKFGETLTAVTTGLTSEPSGALGALSYQWKHGGTNLSDISGATGSSYTLTVDDIDAVIHVTVEAANCTGEVTSDPSEMVGKADQTTPALDFSIDYDANTITITPVEGALYLYNNGAAWITDNVYNFEEDETVELAIYLPESSTHNASGIARATIDTTLETPEAPDAFSLEYIAHEMDLFYDVEITVIEDLEGVEYSFNGIDWGEIIVWSPCYPGETITGYMRFAAIEGESNASGVSSASITLPLFQCETPQIFPFGYFFSISQNVTIHLNNTDGVTIYYTTDGSEPTTESTPFTQQFTLTDSATVKAIAIKAGMADSDIVSETFTKIIKGDVNFDGQINMQDVLLIYQTFRHKVLLDPDSEYIAANVNSDGSIDMVDVLMTYQYFRGMITELPPIQ